MQRAAEILTGEHDYKSFCSNPQMKKSTVRIVDSIEIVRRKVIYFNSWTQAFYRTWCAS